MVRIVMSLNDSLEILAPAASACLVARSSTSSIFFSFSPASARSTPSTGKTALGGPFAGGVLGDRGNGQRSLRELDQISDAHTELFVEVLGDIGQFLVQLFAKILERGVIPELAVLARTESLTKRLGVIQLEHENSRVGQDSLGGCRGLSLLDREPHSSDEPQASEESPAKYRNLRRTHQMKLRF